MDDHEWLKPKQVSVGYPLSVDLLAQLRFRGLGPKYFKPTPRTVLYRRSDIEAWIAASERTGTSANGAS